MDKKDFIIIFLMGFSIVSISTFSILLMNSTGKEVTTIVIEKDTPEYEWYHFQKLGQMQGNKKPNNPHLFIETSSGIYFVDSYDNKTLLKTTDNGKTIDIITTRPNKNISRAFYDRVTNESYFVDCDYDNTTSYIWKLGLTDDSIMEITSISTNVFDVWRYRSETYVLYHNTPTFTLGEDNISLNSDIDVQWMRSTGTDNYDLLNEDPSSPDISDYIYENSNETKDIYGFENIDLSGYDSGEVYQIAIYLHCKYESTGKIPTILVSGDQIGTTTPKTISPTTSYAWHSIIFNDLSLEDSHINNFQVTVESNDTNDEWAYTGESFSISAQDTDPGGICWDGTNWWMLGGATDKIYKYDPSWSYTGENYSISAQDMYSGGISWDGTNWWMLGRATDKIYKYDPSWSYTGENYSISAQDIYSEGICWDGTNWWMVGASGGKVYKYDPSWSYTEESYSIFDQDTEPGGISWDGTNWWMLGRATDKIYKYDPSWSYTGENYSISAQDIYSEGICWDGTNWWMIGEDTDKVYKYNSSIKQTIAALYGKIFYYEDIFNAISIKNLDTTVVYSQDMGNEIASSLDCSQICVVGSNFYFTTQWSDENVKLWQFNQDTESFTEMKDLGANTELPPVEQQAICYDDLDYLYFILENSSDSKNNLYTYEISSNTLTKRMECNVTLMLDRNSISTIGSPWEFGKGFHNSNDFVYEISRNYPYLLKIQDLELAVGERIIAISDKYLMTSNSYLYEYTNKKLT